MLIAFLCGYSVMNMEASSQCIIRFSFCRQNQMAFAEWSNDVIALKCYDMKGTWFVISIAHIIILSGTIDFAELERRKKAS